MKDVNTEIVEEIVFLESEIVEDDADAPLGVLINAPVATQAEPETQSQAQEVAEEETQPEKVVEDAKDESVEVAETAAKISEDTTSAEENVAEETPIENAAVADDYSAEGLAVNESAPEEVIAEEVSAEEAIATEPLQSEEAVAQEESAPTEAVEVAPAKAKTTKKAPAKKAVADPWAVAEIKSKNKSGEAAADTDAAKPAVAKKSTAKTKATSNTEEIKKVTKETKTSTKATDAKAKPAAAKAPAKATATAPKAKAAPKKAEAPAETVIIAGDDSVPHGKFVIKKTDKGNFVYKLYSYNHRVVAIGAEQYTSLASCKAGINSVINNAEKAPIEDQTLKKVVEQKCPKWEVYADKKGEIRLRLIASNGNIVATTNDGYLSKDAAKKGIEAIARASKFSAVVRNDNLW